MFLGHIIRSCSVVTIYGTCNNISHIRTFRSVRAVPNMAVFYSSLTSCLPSTLLRYFLNNLEVDPVAPTITGITIIYMPRNTYSHF